MLEDSQKEELRQACLEFLAARHPLAFEPAAVQRLIEVKQMLDFAPDAADVHQALELLVGLGDAEVVLGRLGGSRNYKATAGGVLACERARSQRMAAQGGA